MSRRGRTGGPSAHAVDAPAGFPNLGAVTFGLAKTVMAGAGLGWILMAGGCDRWGGGTRNEVHEANYIEGTNFRFQGQTNRAIQSFERALHVNPSNVQAHMAIADLFHGTSDFPSASYHYRRAKRLQEERGIKADQTLLGLIESCDLQLAVQFSDRLLRQQTDAQLEELRQRLAERDDTLAKLRQELGRLRALTNVPPRADLSAAAILPSGESSRATPVPSPQLSPPSQAAPPTSTSRSVVRTPPAAPEVTPKTATSTSKPATRLRSYTVRRGDTPASIARRAGVSTRALMAVNPGLNPTRMRPGQILQIPAP